MARRPLRDEEPFVTIRAHPRRFAWGIPAVFIISIGAGLPLAERGLSLAIAAQLFIQTVGLLWLYLPVASWREGSGSGSGPEKGRGAVQEDQGLWGGDGSPGPQEGRARGPEAGRESGESDEEGAEASREAGGRMGDQAP